MENYVRTNSKFRSFLIRCLEFFIRDKVRSLRAAKNNNGRPPLSFDQPVEEGGVPEPGAMPEAVEQSVDSIVNHLAKNSSQEHHPDDSVRAILVRRTSGATGRSQRDADRASDDCTIPVRIVFPDLAHRTFGEDVSLLRAAGKKDSRNERPWPLIAQLSDEVVFLHQGSVIARGRAAEITRDPALTEIYFGV